MMHQSTSEERFERKFIAPADVSEVIDTLKQLPFNFEPAYSPRSINNIYFDTADLNDFRTTVEGISERQKIRLRWYGDKFTAPQLELKRKRQLTSQKIVWRDRASQGSLRQWFEKQQENEQSALFEGRRPTIFNNYHRHYFFSRTRGVRITIDERLTYRPVNDHGDSRGIPLRFSDECIVEIKYGEEVSEIIPEISAALPYRVSRNSKYRNGVLLLTSLGIL